MLVQLDEAIDYMQSHPQEKEAETYRSRYKVLLTRALTLIRGHFVNTLRETAADVSKRIADRQLNDTTMSALLYAKFRVGAEEMKNLGLEIHKRAAPPADAEPEVEGEYQSLMGELHTNFAATRGRLIIPLVRKKLADIAQAPSTSTDLIKFARASISYIRGICLDEFELWGEWFHGQRGLYDFLESICEPLYDHLRPRIIHESKLTKLCQLCILLQTRYMMQDLEDNEVEQLQQIMPDPNQLDFPLLIRPALEDTQTRIVFRTQAIVRNDIELYRPKPEDLDYPRRLQQRTRSNVQQGKGGPVLSGRKSSTSIPLTPKLKDPLVVDADLSSDEEDRTTPLPLTYDAPSSLRSQTTYPTLSLCLTLLTRLHRLINTNIFDDLAHQIVHQTLLSLTAASTQIPPPPKPNSPKQVQAPVSTPSHLFLLTHYLHLKTHLLAFDISSSTLNPDITFDFSGPLSTFSELRSGRGLQLFNPVTLMRLISNGTLLPRVVENMLDAKVELDGRLRTIINDFVNEWSNIMTSDLLQTPLQGKKNPTAAAGKMLSQTLSKIHIYVPLLRSTLDSWIPTPTDQAKQQQPSDQTTRVKETLVAAILESVIRSYEIWFDALPPSVRAGVSSGVKGKNKARDETGGGVVSAETDEDLVDVDGFEGIAVEIFGVKDLSLIAEADDEGVDDDGDDRGDTDDDDDDDDDVRSV